MDFSRDVTKLVSSSADGSVRVWDLAAKRQLQYFVNHAGAVTGAAFHPDNKTIVSAGADKTIKVDAVSVQSVFVADDKRINDLAIASNSAWHATAHEDGSVKLWDSNGGTLMRPFPGIVGRALSVTISPNAQQVAAGGADKSIRVWNLNNAQAQVRFETPAEVTRLIFSTDNTKLLASGADHSLRAVDPTPPNPQPAEAPLRPIAQTLTGHTAAIGSLVIAPNNRTALTASADGTAKTWDIAAATFTANLGGHASHIYGLAFSNDCKQLVSASNDKTVRLWDVEKKAAVRVISTQQQPVYGVVFTPDNKSLVIAGGDKTVKLLNVENGAELRVFKGPEFPVYTVALSPDGRTIAAGGVGLGPNRPIFVWNIDSPDPVKKLDGHKDDVYRVRFNAAGNKLLSIGYTGAVNIWDIAAGKPVFSSKLPTITYGGNYVAAGARIATTATDGKTYFVDLPAEAR